MACLFTAYVAINRVIMPDVMKRMFEKSEGGCAGA